MSDRIYCSDCANYQYSSRSEDTCKVLIGTKNTYFTAEKVYLIPDQANKFNTCDSFKPGMIFRLITKLKTFSKA